MAARGERATPRHGSLAALGRRALLPPFWLAFSLALAAVLAPPAFAQNAASIPIAATVVQNPLASARTAGLSSLVSGGRGRQVPSVGERTLLAAGLATLMTEGVEPAAVRVRLEYVGN